MILPIILFVIGAGLAYLPHYRLKKDNDFPNIIAFMFFIVSAFLITISIGLGAVYLCNEFILKTV